MKVYRISKKKYAKDLSGKGAELFGGRWNPIGTAALDTSKSRALCVLELLVHTPKEIAPKNYIILTIQIPKELEKSIIKIEKLPKGWDSLKVKNITQKIGFNSFKDKNTLGIIVPSSIIKEEYNVLLNPNHSDFHKLKIISIEEFKLDTRLLK